MEFEGKSMLPRQVTLTDSATTTARINKIGLAMGSMINLSSSSITVQFYHAAEQSGTAYPHESQDSTDTVSLTIAAGHSKELPDSLASLAILVPVLTAVSSAAVIVSYQR